MTSLVGLRKLLLIGLVVAITVSAYIVNRVPAGPPIDSEALDDTRWRIVAINERPASGWLRFRNGTVSFTAGLNDMSFSYEVGGDRLLVKDGGIFSTLVASLSSTAEARDDRLRRAVVEGRMTMIGDRLTLTNKGAIVEAELWSP